MGLHPWGFTYKRTEPGGGADKAGLREKEEEWHIAYSTNLLAV